MGVAVAVGLTIAITLVISPIDILFRAKKADLRDLLGSAFFLYVGILAIGNVVAALLAYSSLVGSVPEVIGGWLPLIVAFAGVFAFEGVLSNTNVTIFNKGVLTIDDWIEKARGTAVEKAIEEHARAVLRRQLSTAGVLRMLPEVDLNAHLAQAIGPNEVARIEEEAGRIKADPRFYKALELANKAPDLAAELVKAYQKNQRSNGGTTNQS